MNPIQFIYTFFLIFVFCSCETENKQENSSNEEDVVSGSKSSNSKHEKTKENFDWENIKGEWSLMSVDNPRLFYASIFPAETYEKLRIGDSIIQFDATVFPYDTLERGQISVRFYENFSGKLNLEFREDTLILFKNYKYPAKDSTRAKFIRNQK